jgi:hypothetical protein
LFSCNLGIRRRYADSDIFNGDETGLFYRLTPDRTLQFKGEKCSGGKHSKERITAWVCANMDGSEKKKLFIIGKSKSPRCFKNVTKLPVTYEANKRAWMTGELFSSLLLSWNQDLAKDKRKILLVIDNCPAHPKLANLEWIEVVFLPPNVTSVLQSMDQGCTYELYDQGAHFLYFCFISGINKCLKSYYRRQLLLKMIHCDDAKVEMKISLLDAILMLDTAWENVSSKSILNCFGHAGFYVDTGFTEEDDMSVKQWVLSQKVAEAELDEVDLYHWTKNNDISDFEGYDLTEYEKINEEIEVAEFPDDSEIVRSTTEQEENENCIQNESDEDTEADAFPGAQEALAALQTVTRFVRLSLPEEDHSNFLESSSILEKNLYKRMLKKRFQSKITDFF